VCQLVISEIAKSALISSLVYSSIDLIAFHHHTVFLDESYKK
jgi:hypothetical protein